MQIWVLAACIKVMLNLDPYISGSLDCLEGLSRVCSHAWKSISLHTLAVSICEMCFVSDALVKINSVRLCMGLWEKGERGHDFKPIGQVSHNQANVESEASRFLLFKHLLSAKWPNCFLQRKAFRFFIFIFCIVKSFFTQISPFYVYTLLAFCSL